MGTSITYMFLASSIRHALPHRGGRKVEQEGRLQRGSSHAHTPMLLRLALIHLAAATATLQILGDGSLNGLTIRQRGPGKWFGVHCASGSTTITNCILDGATSSCLGVCGGASPTVTGCTVSRLFAVWLRSLRLFTRPCRVLCPCGWI